MNLDEGTLRRLVFTPPKKVNTPTYQIEGPIERYDTRDHVYARMAMKPGSEAFEDYYSRNPEKRIIDDELRKLALKSGQRLIEQNRVNEEIALSGFYGSFALSRPDVVNANFKMLLHPPGRVERNTLQADPHRMARKIKAFGLHLGAAKVGITKLNPNWVYTHEPVPIYGRAIELNYKYVICLAVLQNPYMTRTQNAVSQNWEVGWTYAYASFISLILANFIRHLGWSARPVPTFSSPYMIPPVFIDAGLGEDGRCGYVVSKELGNNWRPGGVLTDLPLAIDKPVDFGLQDFCDKCRICADACPVGAIPKKGRTVVRGIRKWNMDAEKCYKYWNANGHGCGVCQDVCPWNHPNDYFHNTIREIGSRLSWMRKALIWGERNFYSTKPGPEAEWLTEKV